LTTDSKVIYFYPFLMCGQDMYTRLTEEVGYGKQCYSMYQVTIHTQGGAGHLYHKISSSKPSVSSTPLDGELGIHPAVVGCSVFCIEADSSMSSPVILVVRSFTFEGSEAGSGCPCDCSLAVGGTEGRSEDGESEGRSENDDGQAVSSNLGVGK
jgi:hypothetical protein